MILRQTREDVFAGNFTAWVKFYSAPEYETFQLLPDRVIFLHSQEWEDWLDLNCPEWNFSIKKHRPFEMEMVTAVRGWREKVILCSAQFILHEFPEHKFFEVDFDIFNPERGIGPAILHLGEYIRYRLPQVVGQNKHQTNPRLVRARLRKRGMDA